MFAFDTFREQIKKVDIYIRFKKSVIELNNLFERLLMVRAYLN